MKPHTSRASPIPSEETDLILRTKYPARSGGRAGGHYDDWPQYDPAGVRSCRRLLRVPADRGELLLTCPVCRFHWDWSPRTIEMGFIDDDVLFIDEEFPPGEAATQRGLVYGRPVA